MNYRALTFRQRQVLDCIQNSIGEKGYPPTVRELQELLSIRSSNGVADHLKALERKGYIVRERVLSRGIRVVKSETESEVAEMFAKFVQLSAEQQQTFETMVHEWRRQEERRRAMEDVPCTSPDSSSTTGSASPGTTN